MTCDFCVTQVECISRCVVNIHQQVLVLRLLNFLCDKFVRLFRRDLRAQNTFSFGFLVCEAIHVRVTFSDVSETFFERTKRIFCVVETIFG